MPASPGSLINALRTSCRTMAWGPVDDPVAQDVLAFADLDLLAQVLASHGLGHPGVPLEPLGGGVGSVVLAAGDRVVRLGVGPSLPRAPIPEMLPTLARGALGAIRYEVLPRLITGGITPSMVAGLERAVAQRGYAWTDVGDDNVGHRPGDPDHPMILDPGGVDPLPGVVMVPPRPVVQTSADQAACAAWLRMPQEELDLHQGWVSLEPLRLQIEQARASYPDFPQEAARTRRIVRALQRNEALHPVFVERGDPAFFVLEGRHRMVAFAELGLTEIPVVYVGRRTPRLTHDATPTPSRGRGWAV